MAIKKIMIRGIEGTFPLNASRNLIFKHRVSTFSIYSLPMPKFGFWKTTLLESTLKEIIAWKSTVKETILKEWIIFEEIVKDLERIKVIKSFESRKIGHPGHLEMAIEMLL